MRALPVSIVAIFMLACACMLGSAMAQTTPQRSNKGELSPPTSITPPPLAMPALNVPAKPTDQKPIDGKAQPVKFQTKLTEKDQPLTTGLTWRLFNGKLPVPQTAKPAFEIKDSTFTSSLLPGDYVVNVTFGRVNAFRAFTVAATPVNDTIVLGAGGIRFNADVNGKPINQNKLSFSIFTAAAREAERKLIQSDIKPGTIIRLPQGDYYISSRYGDGNAVVGTDIAIQAGKLTDAAIHHKAASVTLKLVSEAGAEAMANTSWTVLTPNGDTVSEFIGAYVTITLLEGEYIVIARYENRVYNTQFSVESGVDKDVEVLAR